MPVYEQLGPITRAMFVLAVGCATGGFLLGTVAGPAIVNRTMNVVRAARKRYRRA